MKDNSNSASGPIPARINATWTAEFLGVKPGDLSIPAVKKLVPPLNDIGPGIVRYWSAAEVLAIGEDSRKLRQITQVIYEYWKTRSAAKRTKGSSS
jgi:hypothetical protein